MIFKKKQLQVLGGCNISSFPKHERSVSNKRHKRFYNSITGTISGTAGPKASRKIASNVSQVIKKGALGSPRTGLSTEKGNERSSCANLKQPKSRFQQRASTTICIDLIVCAVDKNTNYYICSP